MKLCPYVKRAILESQLKFDILLSEILAEVDIRFILDSRFSTITLEDGTLRWVRLC
jgi:hypothetical protein